MNEKDIQQIRDFNRFYTSVIGLLDRHVVNSPYTLPEGRVLYELHHRQSCNASDIIAGTGIDKGYLSRILKSFEKKGLVLKKKSKEDGRAFHIMLSEKGEREFAKINVASSQQIRSLFETLDGSELAVLVNHMKGIKSIITKTPNEL